MTDIERAIREFSGPANAGLRARLRRTAAHGPEAVRRLAAVVALTALGRAKLEAVALATEEPRPRTAAGVEVAGSACLDGSCDHAGPCEVRS